MATIKRIEKDDYFDLDLWIKTNLYWYEITCDKDPKVIVEDFFFRDIKDITYVIRNKQEYIECTLNYFISEYDKKNLDSSWFKKQKLLLENVKDEYIIIKDTKAENDPNRLIIKEIEENNYNEAINYFCELWFITRSFILYWIMDIDNNTPNLSDFIKKENEKIRKNYNLAKQLLEKKDYTFKKVVMNIVYTYMSILFNEYSDKYNTNDVNCDLASDLEDYWFDYTNHCEYLIFPNWEKEDICNTKFENLYTEFNNSSDYFSQEKMAVDIIDIENNTNEVKRKYKDFIEEIEKQNNPIHQYNEWYKSIVEDLKSNIEKED